MTEDFPADIWLYISQFLPDDLLQKMIGVNRLFFDIGMDRRYKSISFTSFKASEAKMLERLSHPVVACRIRRLHLQLDMSHIPFQKQPPPSVGSLGRRVKTAALHAVHLRRPKQTNSSGSKSHALTSSQEVYENLADVFPGLSGLEELNINSWNWPVDFDAQPFFSAAWSSFGSNLRKLSLGGNLEGYTKLIASGPSFDSLQELELEFTNNIHGSNSADTTILLDFVAPFINGLGARLLSLRLWSWSSTDLSSFFKQLGPFPTLRRVGIRAAFNRSLTSDPSGLARLLSTTSSTLQRLELRLDLAGLLNPALELPLAEWLSQTIAEDETITSDLQTLELYPTGSSLGFETLVICIQRSICTLEKLVVRNRYLQFEEVESIVGLFAASEETMLMSLRLNVLRLSTDIFDLLEKALPGLKDLTLNIGDTVSKDSMTFKTAMEGRSFPNWKLYDIGIWQGGAELDSETMLSIANSIPSIRSFWGEGHMGITESSASNVYAHLHSSTWYS